MVGTFRASIKEMLKERKRHHVHSNFSKLYKSENLKWVIACDEKIAYHHDKTTEF